MSRSSRQSESLVGAGGHCRQIGGIGVVAAVAG